MGKISAKGKSKKLTWKKIQHPDVESFLDEVRREERLGLKEKTDDDLFLLDSNPLGFDADYTQLAKKAEAKRTARSKVFPPKGAEGPLINTEELTCFRILRSDSAVKDPVVKRNPIKKGTGLRKTLPQKLKDEVRYFKQEVKAKENSKSKLSSLSSDHGLDLWSNQTDASDVIFEDEWLTDETKRNNVMYKKKTSAKTRISGPEKHAVQAVEVPHPGLSYNPSFASHQALIKDLVDRETNKIRKEEKLKRSLLPGKVEGDGTLPEIKEEIKEEESDADSDHTPKKPATKPKTKQQKRKAIEQRKEVQQKKMEKSLKMKESEVFRVKSLQKELSLDEKRRAERLARRVQKKKDKELAGGRALSKHQFKEKEVDPLLSEELGKTLGAGRKAGTGDLLVDRFKSLQKRNVIETRVKHKQTRKHRDKVYIRDSDKMEWEKTGIWNGEKLLPQTGRKIWGKGRGSRM